MTYVAFMLVVGHVLHLRLGHRSALGVGLGHGGLADHGGALGRPRTLAAAIVAPRRPAGASARPRPRGDRRRGSGALRAVRLLRARGAGGVQAAHRRPAVLRWPPVPAESSTAVIRAMKVCPARAIAVSQAPTVMMTGRHRHRRRRPGRPGTPGRPPRPAGDRSAAGPAGTAAVRTTGGRRSRNGELPAGRGLAASPGRRLGRRGLATVGRLRSPAAAGARHRPGHHRRWWPGRPGRRRGTARELGYRRRTAAAGRGADPPLRPAGLLQGNPQWPPAADRRDPAGPRRDRHRRRRLGRTAVAPRPGQPVRVHRHRRGVRVRRPGHRDRLPAGAAGRLAGRRAGLPRPLWTVRRLGAAAGPARRRPGGHHRRRADRLRDGLHRSGRWPATACVIDSNRGVMNRAIGGPRLRVRDRGGPPRRASSCAWAAGSAASNAAAAAGR